jgi:hypothetical protein
VGHLRRPEHLSAVVLEPDRSGRRTDYPNICFARVSGLAHRDGRAWNIGWDAGRDVGIRVDGNRRSNLVARGDRRRIDDWGVVGWLVVGSMADAYAAQRFSEQMLIIDSIWFLQTLMLCSSLAFESGYWGAMGLLAFVAYKIVTIFGFRAFPAKLRQQPLRLLLLRVFGFSRRSSRLMDLIAARWRYAGNLCLIAAPDLAARTIEPGKLLALLRGRLGRLFVHDRTELDRRLAEIDASRDPDGRFRIAELFCAGDAWRAAVKSLMTDAHVVVMDVRSFGPQHQGCVFELQTLLDTVPLERLMLLVNRGTKLEFLKQILDAQWRELRIDSPNARAAAPTLQLIEVNGSESRGVGYLMRAAAAIALVAPFREGPFGPARPAILSGSPGPSPIVTST